MEFREIFEVIYDLDMLLYENCLEVHGTSLDELDEICMITFRGHRDCVVIEYMGSDIWGTENYSWEELSKEELGKFLLNKIVKINKVLYSTNKVYGVED